MSKMYNGKWKAWSTNAVGKIKLPHGEEWNLTHIYCLAQKLTPDGLKTLTWNTSNAKTKGVGEDSLNTAPLAQESRPTIDK